MGSQMMPGGMPVTPTGTGTGAAQTGGIAGMLRGLQGKLNTGLGKIGGPMAGSNPMYGQLDPAQQQAAARQAVAQMGAAMASGKRDWASRGIAGINEAINTAYIGNLEKATGERRTQEVQIAKERQAAEAENWKKQREADLEAMRVQREQLAAQTERAREDHKERMAQLAQQREEMKAQIQQWEAERKSREQEGEKNRTAEKDIAGMRYPWSGGGLGNPAGPGGSGDPYVDYLRALQGGGPAGRGGASGGW